MYCGAGDDNASDSSGWSNDDEPVDFSDLTVNNDPASYNQAAETIYLAYRHHKRRWRAFGGGARRKEKARAKAKASSKASDISLPTPMPSMLQLLLLMMSLLGLLLIPRSLSSRARARAKADQGPAAIQSDATASS